MYFSVIRPKIGKEREIAHSWYQLKPLSPSSFYQEHQYLWQFFPAEAGTPQDFLFRCMEKYGLPWFYVVAPRAPCPNPQLAALWEIQTRPYAPALMEGDVLQFEIKVNPVVTHDRGGKTAGLKQHHKKHDVVMEYKKQLLQARGLTKWGDWRANHTDSEGKPDPRPNEYALIQTAMKHWLTQKGQRHGFAVVDGAWQAEGYTPKTYRYTAPKESKIIQFSTVDLQGELTVTEPQKFAQMLQQGLGRARAFGCGLMLVKRMI